jgi:hypothetical protein
MVTVLKKIFVLSAFKPIFANFRCRFRQQIFGSRSLISAGGLVTVLKNDVDGDDW